MLFLTFFFFYDLLCLYVWTFDGQSFFTVPRSWLAAAHKNKKETAWQKKRSLSSGLISAPMR